MFIGSVNKPLSIRGFVLNFLLICTRHTIHNFLILTKWRFITRAGMCLAGYIGRETGSNVQRRRNTRVENTHAFPCSSRTSKYRTAIDDNQRNFAMERRGFKRGMVVAEMVTGFFMAAVLFWNQRVTSRLACFSTSNACFGTAGSSTSGSSSFEDDKDMGTVSLTRFARA